MPVYEFGCSDCNKKFDVFTPQRMELDNVVCRHCHGTNVRRLVSVFASIGGSEEMSFTDSSSEPSSGGGCCGGGCGCGCSH